MIVQCESCETRFHVADARIPEKGARVRCSRCHHRFHITPSSAAPAAPAPAADGSARPAANGSGPRGNGPRTAEPRTAGGDDLDNPEFLFDDNTSPETQQTLGARTPSKTPKTPVTTRMKVPTPAVAKPKPKLERKPEPKARPAEKPAPGEKPASEGPAAPPEPPKEERFVATGGQTAQQMLDAGAPRLADSKGEFEGPLLGNSAGEDEGAKSFFLGEDPAKEAAKPKDPPRPAAKDDKFKDIDAAFGASLADDSADSTDAGWEALTKDAQDAPASVFEAGASFGLAAGDTFSAPEEEKPATVFDQPDIPESAQPAKKRGAPEAVNFDPEAGSSAALIVRIAAVLVGVALLGGALRGLSLQREATTSAAAVEQAAGWVASDVETFVARDSTGARVLVVRGNLFPDGAAPPPEVEVSLLETDGSRVGEPRRAWLQRLDDAEIAPDRLALRLASNAGELSGLGPQITGFTALLPDPPARARRVAIALNAGKAQPRGTALATTPPPAAPVPTPAPAPAPTSAPEPAPAPALAPQVPAVPAPAGPPTTTASEPPPLQQPPAPPKAAPLKAAPTGPEVLPASPAPEPE